MLKTARVILTWDCDRKCEGCCNQEDWMKEQRLWTPYLKDLHQLRKFEAVALTGGEPMTKCYDKLYRLAGAVKRHFPGMVVYVYLSDYRSVADVKALMPVVDGFHYTLHKGASFQDMLKFEDFQVTAMLNPGKSYRLYIQEGISTEVRLDTSVWSRVELKPWLSNCPLPKNEKLFELRGI